MNETEVPEGWAKVTKSSGEDGNIFTEVYDEVLREIK